MQMDVRANIREYFDKAYEGEPVLVPKNHDRNIVIISESQRRFPATRASVVTEEAAIPPRRS